MRDSAQDGQEVEIKLVTTPERLDALLGTPALQGAESRVRAKTVYHDSADGRLRAAGLYLRNRHIHGANELTLKNADATGGITRGEWTGTLEGDAPDLSVLPEPARQLATCLLNDAALHPYARIDGKRTTRTITNGSAIIEAAFDQGVITANGSRAEICELELEVREGRLADALRLALKLPLGRDLCWSIDSKADRAWRLATGDRARATKATPIVLEPGATAAAGFRRIAWNCLHQLLANYPLVIEQGDADALHQSRVALRRLRAALSIHKALVADERFERLKTALRDTAAALGRARDLDVLIGRLTPVQGKDGVAPLLEALRRRRTQSYARARAMLGAAGFQRLLLRTALWVEEGAWHKAAAAKTAAAPDATATAALASARLRRFRKAIKQAPEDLAQLDTAQRHALRIRAKKLRYANEFFASLWSGPKRARRQQAFADALERLQDRLGELNDLQTQQSLALDGQIEVEAAAVLERALGRGRRSTEKLMKAANKARDDVLAVRRFWKKKGRTKTPRRNDQPLSTDTPPPPRA